MTFIEMVEKISQDTGLRKDDVRTVLLKFRDITIVRALTGLPVSIPKFGKFTGKFIKPRIAFGKQTKGRMVVKFKSFT